MPENTLLNSVEKRGILSHIIPHGPRKQTRDHIHFWQARRKDRRLLDKALIRGFYEPELVHG